MNFELSPRGEDFRDRVREFIRDRIIPVEQDVLRAAPRGAEWKTWTVSPVVDELEREARSAGLSNLFLPDEQLGAGLSTMEYAPLAEEMGRSQIAPVIFNCNAPDTGNMEVLWKYGTPAQRERFLVPLLEARIRSAFCMTEPDVASSDATNLRATITVDGDDIVLSGRKWWSTGIGHPRCEVVIFMGRSDPAADRHRQHSMVLVPMDAKGVTVKRMLSVFGEYDAPYGHGEVWFEDVRVPRANIIAGLGRGFEIAQGRLGPGRIHHCMRCIGAAEWALELLVTRAMTRSAFGKPIVELGGNRERIADLRIAIDQARLLTLRAAFLLDRRGAQGAMAEISAIKVVAPSVLQQTVDAAMQIHGGAGLSDDLPLAALFAQARMLRIADGPDEVHRGVIARIELAKYRDATG